MPAEAEGQAANDLFDIRLAGEEGLGEYV